ncbi:Transposase [Variovorax sp. YR752]|uniref:IS1182 family transposase n=1 Tax=Variovorax sp. YR752 TaxID=1884383 RepID=UPI000BCDC6CF|nr:IS1182 family transposase [Variovorax sp. YR752]SOD24109.1 Transposase [Variovorax sp. YR752]SOE06404.1 Transposase [Variovorax sp. YR752]
MKRFIEPGDRSQTTLLPECLDDYISEENPIRVVDVFVDELKLYQLGFEGAEPAATGRPSYHPSVLLKIYIYGYLNQVQSSRRLEREAQRNVELMWLTGRLAPDFKTIADFRRDHGDAIRLVCREFVLLCRRLKLFADGVIAVDGSKFKGVNNRDKNFNEHKLQVRMQQLEQSIGRYLAELDRADRDPAMVLPERVARLQEKVAKIKGQMREISAIERQLQSTQERQISLTDPDARSMATSRLGSAVVGYNVQAAVDAKHHMIVAHEVTNAVTDRGQLAAISKAAQEAIEHPKPIVLADRGYFEGYGILECERAGIATLVPKPLTSNSKFEGRFDKRDFVYDKRRDVYRCPAGEIAIYRFTAIEDGKALRKYWTSNCGGCHLKPQCTPAPARRISRWEYEEVLEKVQARLDAAPEASKFRQRTIEHVFGTLKAWMGATHFLTKTLPNVKTEMNLQVLAYNLKRAINILGASTLIAEMKS